MSEALNHPESAVARNVLISVNNGLPYSLPEAGFVGSEGSITVSGLALVRILKEHGVDKNFTFHPADIAQEPPDEQQFFDGRLVIRRPDRVAFVDGYDAKLRYREFGLFELLCRYPDTYLPRLTIYQRAWYDEPSENLTPSLMRTVDAHVKRVRERLERPLGLGPEQTPIIKNKRLVGYGFWPSLIHLK